MARMIPSVISPEIESNAEKKIFRWFENAPDTEDWIVLHSLGILGHHKTIFGETDFLVLVPNHGLFVLEVKGGRVKREEGIWAYTNRYGNTTRKSRGPFEQVRDAAFSIIDGLKSKLDRHHLYLADIFWGTGVMFPDIEYDATGLDEEQWQIFDSRDGNNVRDYLLRLAGGSRKVWKETYGPLNPEKLPSLKDVRYIANLLRGDFDKAILVGAQLRHADSSLTELTREQYRCLDQLEDNPRCFIQGSAGTGKTLLAVKEVERSVVKGENVALFCYNKNLAEWLGFHFLKQPDNLRPAYIGTFHKFMLDLLKKNGISVHVPENISLHPDFFNKQLPEKALSILENNSGVFDKIIIDESQDLIRQEYLLVLDSCLKKGLERGSWIMFGDLMRQAIYEDDRTGGELMELIEEFTSFVRFKLTVNCRNTKPICEQMQMVTGLSEKQGLLSKIEGPPVEYITYSTDEEQEEKLVQLLDRLKTNRVESSEVTIISPSKWENSIVSRIMDHKIKEFRVEGNKQLSFCTVHSFKGLENSVIILTDIETFQDARIMYVAYSRARTGLFVLLTKKANREYQEIVQRRLTHER